MRPGLRRLLGVTVFVLLLAAALVAAPAQALSPPDVFLQELDASDQPTGAWIPFQGAHCTPSTAHTIDSVGSRSCRPSAPVGRTSGVPSTRGPHPMAR
jgi:hypothetical protein